jgi:hypothetical protein
MHRSPGGVTCEASLPARRSVAESRPPPARDAADRPPTDRRPTADQGGRRTHAYTPAMRRWVCIVALLAGFAGDDYVRGVRLREPVAVERLIDTRVRGTRGLVPTGAWWSRQTG